MSEHVEVVEESQPFIRMVPVINVERLDGEVVEDLLGQCYMSENGVEQDYVEWNTGWNFSAAAKSLSDYLVLRGVPKGKNFLLKMIKE